MAKYIKAGATRLFSASTISISASTISTSAVVLDYITGSIKDTQNNTVDFVITHIGLYHRCNRTNPNYNMVSDVGYTH